MTTIIDYKTGNLGSIQNILKKIGEKSIITSAINEIAEAKRIILPGVGAFDTGMSNLSNLGIIEILNHKALVEKVPVLGICLGMQLLSNKSEEGVLPGLGWIDAETVKFNFVDTSAYKIPHMGWNFVHLEKVSRLFSDMYDDARFYFVHSFHFKAINSIDILTSTSYEIDFTSAVEKENILGVQFHPEKSHKFGMKLLQNFIEFY